MRKSKKCCFYGGKRREGAMSADREDGQCDGCGRFQDQLSRRFTPEAIMKSHSRDGSTDAEGGA
eukprot:2166366-Pleurochrysis_carterae.AAC.5